MLPRPSRQRARRLACAVAAASALGAVSLEARADGDPNIQWWTITTPHFHVHYPKSAEPAAERIAAHAEGIHSRLVESLGYDPKERTEIALTDDTDDANGSATALPYNTIRLFLTAPDDISPLNDYDDWYLELLTHEYTHILHTDNISGGWTVINAILGKTLSINQIQPRWILEGLAVVKESEHSSGGRLRSSIWDMYMRSDVIADNFATLDQVSSGAYRWPQGNLWYLYGSRFLRWISDVYGPNTMRAVSADYGAALVPFGINRTIRRVTGRTYEQLWVGFKDYVKRGYADQIAAIEKRGVREGSRVTSHGRTVHYPRFVPKQAGGAGDRLVYFRSDQNARPGLYEIDLADPKHPEELVARTGATSSATYTPAGDLVFTDSVWWRNLYSRNDVMMVPKGERSPNGEEKTRKQLTFGLRALFPDVSPDGRQIVFTVNSIGTTYLEIADLAPDGVISGRRDLVPSARYDQAYTPKFSPDGKKVAYSGWFRGGYRDVRIVDVATGAVEEVTHDRAIDLDPAWSPDGATLYFVSDRSGVPNVHAYDVATHELQQVTNVRTGAFMPAISPSGKTLVYAGYTTEGFDLFSMPIERSRFLRAVEPPSDRPAPPEAPPHVEMTKAHYDPLPTLVPRHYLFSLAPSPYGSTAITFTAKSSDIVGIHNLALNVTADARAPTPQLTVDYSFNRLPFDLDMHFFHTVVPRAGYRVNNEDLGYDEYNTGLTTGASYTSRDNFATHNFGVSFSAAHFKGDLPVARYLDPYNTTTINPPEGNLDVVHAGYGFSNVETGLDAAGPINGFSLSVGADYASNVTGSQYAVRAFEAIFTKYVEMPWLHHTVALRTAGAISSGNYPHGSSYAVGGYDLSNNSLPSSIISGVFNGAFVLRGYPARVYNGSSYLLENIEYRAPILKPDHGLSMFPMYLRRVDANFFLDYGGAFNNLDVKNILFFRNGAIIDAPQLHTSLGGELWLGVTMGYGLSAQLRFGFAHGFSKDAMQPGQFYFVASSAF